MSDRELCGDPLPMDFSVGVIVGPSGSGKTLLLKMIRRKLDAHLAQSQKGSGPVVKGQFIPDVLPLEVSCAGDAIAVASRSEFSRCEKQSVAIEKLSCVGFNKIPGWLTPYEHLSNGEQSRARLAMHLESDSIIDDFCGTVDNQNSCAVAASLGKVIRSTKAQRVLVATSKQLLISFLKPDFVIIARTAEVVSNPEILERRALEILWKTPGMNRMHRAPARWDGEVDQMTDVLNCGRQYEALGRVAFKGRFGERPVNEVVLRCNVQQDATTAEVANAFEHEFDGEREQKIFVPNVKLSLFNEISGAIIGPSGSGKTTALRTFSGPILRTTDLSWESGVSVIAHFAPLIAAHPYLLEDVCCLPNECLLRPFATLSTGEKHRTEIARLLAEGGGHSESIILIVDEFTSNLDRPLGCKLAANLQNYLKHNASTLGIRLIVAGIYEDIISHLMPSWVLHSRTGTVSVPMTQSKIEEPSAIPYGCADSDMFAQQLITGDGAPMNNRADVVRLLRPPKMELTIRRVQDLKTIKLVWDKMFKEHHYLQGNLPTNNHFAFVARHGPFLVGFCSSAMQWGGGFGDISYREARLVILPEYSGFGLGPRFSDIVAQAYRDHGCRYLGITAHPRLGGWRESSPWWIATKQNLKKRSGNAGDDQLRKRALKSGKEPPKKSTKVRICFSHEFAGRQLTLVPPVPPKQNGSKASDASFKTEEKDDTVSKGADGEEEEKENVGAEPPCKIQRTADNDHGSTTKVEQIRQYIVSVGGSCGACKIAGAMSSRVGGGINLAFLQRHFEEYPSGSRNFRIGSALCEVSQNAA